MDSLNKVISFALGLLVVVIFLAVVAGKIRVPGFPWKGSLPATPTKTIAPSPTKTTAVVSPTPSSSTYNTYQTPTIQKGIVKPTSIPSTGVSIFFIPSLLSGLFAGFYLRNNKKKN